MKDARSADEMRQRIQESLARAKRTRLRDEFGMQAEYTAPGLSPGAQNEWLDYVLELERQFENPPMITVRERIGDPPIQPVQEIPPHALGAALDDLLELLAEHGIAVDFLGEWDALGAYRYLTNKLLDVVMQDIRIEGTFIRFTATTPEYDVQMWVEHYVHDVYRQDRDRLLPRLEKQPLFDAAGEPITLAKLVHKLEAVWARLPATKRVDVRPIETQVAEDEASVTAVIAWRAAGKQKQVESSFRLRPSPYSGWDVVWASLLDDLLAC